MHGEYHERTAEPRIRAVPMSHLSIELGHLYLEDLLAGPGRVRQLFIDAAPWAAAGETALGVGRPRVSTCFLIDDYFSKDLAGPETVIPMVTGAAAAAGVRLDYLGRESACAQVRGPAGDVSPAGLMIHQLVAEPPPDTNGLRPPAHESGWLSNGQRSPAEGETTAMEVLPEWQHPVQTSARMHSVFVDVELWIDREQDGDRVWSCALLAATWQLLRLGLLRKLGEPLAEPMDPPSEWPASWAELPGLIRLNPAAHPFAAYQTLSLLSPRFLPVEQAVRTILSQIQLDPAVTGTLSALASKQQVPLPPDALDRIGYVFAGSGLADPR